MEKGSTINPLETRKPRSPWVHIAIAVVFLLATGTAAWALITREPVEHPPDEWMTHSSEEGAYSAKFPEAPELSSRSPENDGPIHMATTNLSMRVYSVAWTDNLAAQIEVRGVDDVLLDAMVGGSESIGGVITNSIELKWNGHSGREFWLDVPGGKAHYRILAVGTRLYTLAIIHAPDFEPNHDLFFNSFVLTQS
ncbi:MAG: hypothetical protein K8I27_13235 [Planctomycetes bacterium]|nr:hypothetical protein [Planctomycetota bacterium]